MINGGMPTIPAFVLTNRKHTCVAKCICIAQEPNPQPLAVNAETFMSQKIVIVVFNRRMIIYVFVGYFYRVDIERNA